MLRLKRAAPYTRIATLGCIFVIAAAGGLAAVENETASRARWANDDDRFDGHMAAGEHRLAQEMAQSQRDLPRRDQWLSRLAENQASHGAIARSVETASHIQSDRARSSALSTIRNQSYGQSDEFGGGGAAGGGVVADFDSLIDLIQNTIAVDSWTDVGGPGSIEEFAAGVHIDATGTLRRIEQMDSDSLERLRDSASSHTTDGRIEGHSSLRMISINRLEKEIQLLAAMGKSPTEAMKNLAGLWRIEYIFVYPESQDIVIAGPGGAWTYDGDGRAVSLEGNHPILQLDDLVVCLRNAFENDGIFGCSIDPRAENLAATQQFLATSRLTGQRWRTELRNTMGVQDIRIYGIDPTSHAAHVLIEADYRMKMIGMGLEEGVVGVDSYLDMVELDENGNPPPMDVIRWWFAMKYDSVSTNEDRNAYQLNGPAVHVLSESEFLDARGERVHTGRSSEPTSTFARSFSREFDALAAKYPIYGELRNVFDLALVAALIREESLDAQVDWNLTYFGSPSDSNTDVYEIESSVAPTQVDTIMNHRQIEARQNGRRVRHTIVGVSGGVVADTRDVSNSDAIVTVADANLQSNQSAGYPDNIVHHDWWWE